MKIIKRTLLHNWPPFVLTALVLVIALVNFKPDTYLTGWDNLHPEFNFGINIKASFFSVWQEYQGLGLVGGMAHAADLLHQIFLLFLSFFLPGNSLRYIWTFLMLGTGAIGAYYFIRFLLKHTLTTRHTERHEDSDLMEPRVLENEEDNRKTHHPHSNYQLYAFLGGLFYLLNLATIQMFYAPFEAFIGHYASLPWIMLTVFLFWEKQSFKRLMLLSIVFFLSTPAFYLPTLFVVTMIVISIAVGVLLLIDRKRAAFIKALKLYSVIFIVNAFWLIPFLYFTMTNANVNVESKMNQMATEYIFAQNKEFGYIQDVTLLRGFWFNNVDPNTNGEFGYMLAPWRDHIGNPIIATAGYILFVFILFGLYYAIRRRNAILISLTILFLFAFTMLSTSTPPFSFLNDLFRGIPLFRQAFRFPFTKFSLLTALMYSTFFSFGVYYFSNQLKERVTTKQISYVPYLCIAIILLFSIPVFRGNLFYEKERLSFPQEYFELFKFFDTQDKNTRIANFPQHTFWGWNFYRWGYGGSGFLWHGIQQPILDRAFDVWSKESENYYFELSTALYAKNPALFQQVLSKYQVNWLVIDKNIIDPFSPKATFIPELQDMISKLPNTITKERQLGSIEIYKVRLPDTTKSFVYFTPELTTTNEYKWNDYDKAYEATRNYASMDTGNVDVYYPLRSLFSKKLQENREFEMNEDVDSIDFYTRLPADFSDKTLVIPRLSEEVVFPVEVVTRREPDSSVTVGIIIRTPEIFIGNQKIYGEQHNVDLFILPPGTSFPMKIRINNSKEFVIKQETATIGIAHLVSEKNNYAILKDRTGVTTPQVIPPGFFQGLPIFKEKEVKLSAENEKTLTISVPKIDDGVVSYHMSPGADTKVVNCNFFRNTQTTSRLLNQEGGRQSLVLSSRNATGCKSYYSESLYHDIAYAIFVRAKNIKGQGMHFWVLNEDEKYAPIATFLPRDKQLRTSQFILPPMEQQGKAYSFHFENISVGNDQVENEFVYASVYPVPYRFLTSLVLKSQTPREATGTFSDFSVEHPISSKYVITVPSRLPRSAKTLVVSQAYSSGWNAYAITNSNAFKEQLPFLFGKRLTNHIKVNNWSNGWKIDNLDSSNSNITFVVVYTPQYLQYLGMTLVVVYVGILVQLYRRRNT